jgi:acetoin utilization deacetylase AcuC-like enzyme
LIAYDPSASIIPLPDGHRFPASKYALLRAELLGRGALAESDIAPSPVASFEALATAHDPAYVAAMRDGAIAPDAMRRIGFPWSPRIYERAAATCGGALAAAREAIRSGWSGQLAGGTHHAHYDFGAGYCVFNDQAFAALTLLSEGAVARVAIIDLDVHQGDGTASLLSGRADCFVFSMHGARNFPFRKARSSLDVALPDGVGDADYLRALGEHLPAVFAFRPDIVLYQAGVDPLGEDKLGRMALTHEGLKARDLMVFETAKRHGVPVSIAIGGGYAAPIAASVEAYANTWDAARQVY